jgi:hypothetical protein
MYFSTANKVGNNAFPRSAYMRRSSDKSAFARVRAGSYVELAEPGGQLPGKDLTWWEFWEKPQGFQKGWAH